MSHIDTAYWSTYGVSLLTPLRLNQWRLVISDDVADEENDYLAYVMPTPGRLWAAVALCRNWECLSPDEQRQVFVHELLHLHFFNIETVIDKAATNFSAPWLGYLSSLHQEQIEYSVDALSEVIAPFLPLPASPRRQTGVSTL